MSLEQAIERCATAIQGLTTVLSNRTEKGESATSAVAAKKAGKKGADQRCLVDEAPTNPSQSNAEVGLDLYQQAATAITTLSRQKGREAALGVLATFGASKLPAVPTERLQEVITAAEQALGAGA
jgi:hypothetical protein